MAATFEKEKKMHAKRIQKQKGQVQLQLRRALKETKNQVESLFNLCLVYHRARNVCSLVKDCVQTVV